MARIPKYELEYLKNNLSLLSLVQSQGHKLKRQGESYVCLCPFHQEKTPSCSVTPSKRLWHCFGCGAGGSIIDWQMRSTGQTLREAVAFLHERLAWTRKDDGSPAPQPQVKAVKTATAPEPPPLTVPPHPTLTDLDDDGQALLHQAVDWYHRNLLNSPEALAWLEKRGLNHPDLVSYFKLGSRVRTGSPVRCRRRTQKKVSSFASG